MSVSDQVVLLAQLDQPSVQIIGGQLQSGRSNGDVEALLGTVIFVDNLGHKVDDMVGSLECVVLLLSGARADAVGEIFHVENEGGHIGANAQQLVSAEGSVEALHLFAREETEMIDNRCSTGHEGFIPTVKGREENVLHLSHHGDRTINQTGKPHLERGIINHTTTPELAAVGVCVGETGKKKAVLAGNFLEFGGGKSLREGLSLGDNSSDFFPHNSDRDSAVAGIICVEDEAVLDQKVGLVCHFVFGAILGEVLSKKKGKKECRRLRNLTRFFEVGIFGRLLYVFHIQTNHVKKKRHSVSFLSDGRNFMW